MSFFPVTQLAVVVAALAFAVVIGDAGAAPADSTTDSAELPQPDRALEQGYTPPPRVDPRRG